MDERRSQRYSSVEFDGKFSEISEQIISVLKGSEDGMTLMEIHERLPDQDFFKIAEVVWGIELMGPGDIGSKGLVEFTTDHKFRLEQPPDD